MAGTSTSEKILSWIGMKKEQGRYPEKIHGYLPCFFEKSFPNNVFCDMTENRAYSRNVSWIARMARSV